MGREGEAEMIEGERRERAGGGRAATEAGGGGARKQDAGEEIRRWGGASNAAGRPVGEAPSPSVEPPSSDAHSTAAAPPADDGSGEESRRRDNSRRRQLSQQHRVVRGGVKVSFVGPNVEALPVWGALDAIAGSTLLVDCRTPAQWRAGEHRPTAQVV